MVGFGNLTQDEIDFSLNLFSRYSKGKGTTEITLLLNGKDVTIPAVNLENLNEKIKKYQITM